MRPMGKIKKKCYNIIVVNQSKFKERVSRLKMFPARGIKISKTAWNNKINQAIKLFGIGMERMVKYGYDPWKRMSLLKERVHCFK